MPSPSARKIKPFVNLASFLTVAVTFALFIAAAVTKGITEELLLEAAVFLISVKLVIGNYKTHTELAAMRRELAALCARPQDAEQVRPNRDDL